MESTSAISVLDRQNQDLGKRDYSASTNTSSPNCEPAKRVRNSKGERNFICSRCDKSYMSYAALYTHCRTKHDGLTREELNYMKKQSTKLISVGPKKRTRSPVRASADGFGQLRRQEGGRVTPALRRYLERAGLCHQTAEVAFRH
jgi:hypothetical protein